MQMFVEEIDLEKWRVAAGLSQASIATQLGVSPSQVSRYEQEPDNVPARIIREWMRICGYMAASKGLELGDPRSEINARVELMDNYATVDPNPSRQVEPNAPITSDEFLRSVHVTASKPRIGVFGRYDAGKSRLINTLIGGNRLPTRYQPSTSVLCLIRHMNDKPQWLAEDVLIMRKGFDLNRADDERYCLGDLGPDGHDTHGFKLVAGGYDALANYGTHASESRTSEAFAAIVYIDAPILLGADILDVPGYGNSNDDHTRAEMGQKMADILVYASAVIGFFDQYDRGFLGALLRTMPDASFSATNAGALRNLFIVATHAHQVPAPELETLLHEAARRQYKDLEFVWDDLAGRSDTQVRVSQSEFESRFFTFSADNPTLRSHFQSDLIDLIQNVAPARTLQQLDRHVRAAKAEAKAECDNWINSLSFALNEREKAQAEVATLEALEPERIASRETQVKRIHTLIDQASAACNAHVADVYGQLIAVDEIERMIKLRYDDKKEAQRAAGQYLLDKLQASVNTFVKKASSEFGKEVDTFLDDFDLKARANVESSDWTFDAKAAFMGGLAGAGTVGALATWASIAAAGSNLGGYILIAQIVGWLSSIGISLGGTGTVISAVAAIGGPVTLAITAGILVFLFGINIFGESWQRKLAKKLHDAFEKENVMQNFKDGITRYWEQTSSAFDVAVDTTEKAYLDNIARLKALANSKDRASLERELQHAEEIRDFFVAIPWRATSA